jgi:hypothetical protein|tara:strand:- start:1987 stop:2304 length:318 start_codon:yes stop_codon:yes gene_type:complete
MWKLNLSILRRRRKKNSEIENNSLNILPSNLQKEFMKSRKDRAMDVLVEIYKPKDRGHVQTCFKAPWRSMEMVDKIETLVSIEKDISAHRQELCKELMDMSKGKW